MPKIDDVFNEVVKVNRAIGQAIESDVHGKLNGAHGKLDGVKGNQAKTHGKLDEVKGNQGKTHAHLDELKGKHGTTHGKLDKLDQGQRGNRVKLDELKGNHGQTHRKLDEVDGHVRGNKALLEAIEAAVMRVEGKISDVDLSGVDARLTAIALDIAAVLGALARIEQKLNEGSPADQELRDAVALVLSRVEQAGKAVGTVQWQVGVDSRLHITNPSGLLPSVPLQDV
jgi:chromosome segregation ATPase